MPLDLTKYSTPTIFERIEALEQEIELLMNRLDAAEARIHVLESTALATAEQIESLASEVPSII